ncbi:NAD(P)-dependent dehydrogenase (short-subunit alcohol dehydrogenase family) [Microbacterium sp. SORGH_AS 1204]|uniref:SDR family NAD(P)-dependent oxidoreductase n=1 Tax=Microbacterium sp. SORGH_AS_1204 TaxID=3041785 RepID=UPI00278F528F|nr:SDR family NAD(P)-dependent oxidoreductase [Microbacterium sp. SORGH_AS_1204]MDQ1135359.1 NAD(P)-dependent dehydrogenase (short-subunit alcohol dehydrogenase family) [Microbacterium sp. SORGH_AS_1204]
MARTDWDSRNLPDLTGKTYLVTGATRGLGYFACQQLAAAGAHVVLTGRNPNRLVDAKSAVKRSNPDAAIETLLLDTSNMGSVRAAAATVRARGRLDGLLLNAGVVHPPKQRQVVGGHELVFATNVLGHFALAGELLKPLAAARGRMVWVGSMSTSIWAHLPTDPELVEGYTPWRAYVQSKAATTSLALGADKRLRAHGVPVQSLVAHPGYSTSGRTRGVRGVNEPSRLTRFVDNLQAPITQSKEQGAWALVRALVDPRADGGAMYGPALIARGAPRVATPARRTRRSELGADLWRACETATHVRWPFDRARRAAS